MIAGILKDRITIKRATVTKNSFGEEEEVWVTATTTRAFVKQSSSQRTESNDEIVYDFTKEFRVRYYVDVRPFDIIEWKNQNYRVISIDKMTDLQQITIIAQLIND